LLLAVQVARASKSNQLEVTLALTRSIIIIIIIIPHKIRASNFGECAKGE
jgi:hypothetical protein